MERHGEDTGRTLSAWRRFAPTVPVWGFIFDGLFFHSDSTLYFNSFFPVTMISTDCSSCSALSVSLPNVVQRQPLSVAIQAHYSVKIAGPENEVSGWMSSSVRNQSKEMGGAIRPWSLSAWRRFAPTVPVFGDFGKRLNPRLGASLFLGNTCPQPTSVQERLSPRLHSPWSKNMKRFRSHTPLQ